MKNLVNLLISLAIILPNISGAQKCNVPLDQNDIPHYIDDESEQVSNYIDKVNAQYKIDVSAIDHPYKKQLKRLYAERADVLTNYADDGQLYSNESLQNKIDEIGRKLLTTNKIREQQNVTWLIHRTYNPNAACYGEGTIMLNLGLISRLENQEQLAFVMAHELAHHHLDHVNSRLKSNVEFLYDDSTQELIKEASRNSSNGREELLEFLDATTLNSAKHSRIHELETDALGLEFYSNAGFSVNEAIGVLKILKNVDSGKHEPASYSKVFGGLDLEWNEDWLISKLSGFSLIKPTEDEIEQYRTHPDTDLRIEQLINLGAEVIDNKLDEEWCKMASQFDLDLLSYAYWQGEMFEAFILGMHLFEKYPNNEYVQQVFANSLLDITIARKDYYLSKYIPPPNVKMNSQKFDAATFFDNIKYSDLDLLTSQWIDKNLSNQTKGEAYEAIIIKQQYLLEQNITEAFNQFMIKYPKRNYLTFLE